MSARRRVRHRLEFGLVLLARAIDRVLGPRLAGRVAAALGRFTYRVLRIRRGVVDDQIRLAFPDRDEAWRRQVAIEAYEHLGREAMMLLRLSRLGPEDVVAATDMDAGGLAAIRASVDAGVGAVLVTGHFGNWEIAGASAAARGIPVDVVAQRQANPLVDRLVNDARERLGMRIMRRGGATRGALRSLRRGRAVGLVADQDARAGGVFVPFFGRPASTHRGPAVLALRAGAPVFMGTAVRKPDGRYRVTIREIPAPRAGEPDDRADRFTAALAAALESAVREEPGQYLWHHRRWKTRPGNGGAVERYDAGGRDGLSEATST